MCIDIEWPHGGTVLHMLYVPFTGSSQKKTVYVDSPLLKTEMTVRERSHIYHEESLKLSIKKNGSKNVFHLMTELPEGEQQLSPVCNHTKRYSLICGIIVLFHQNNDYLFSVSTSAKSGELKEKLSAFRQQWS